MCLFGWDEMTWLKPLKPSYYLGNKMTRHWNGYFLRYDKTTRHIRIWRRFGEASTICKRRKIRSDDTCRGAHKENARGWTRRQLFSRGRIGWRMFRVSIWFQHWRYQTAGRLCFFCTRCGNISAQQMLGLVRPCTGVMSQLIVKKRTNIVVKTQIQATQIHIILAELITAVNFWFWCIFIITKKLI